MGDTKHNGDTDGNGVATQAPSRISRLDVPEPTPVLKARSGWSAEYAPAPESARVTIAVVVRKEGLEKAVRAVHEECGLGTTKAATRQGHHIPVGQ